MLRCKRSITGDFRTSQNSVADEENTDYRYDPNGNLKKDLNKDIGTTGADGIEYNHLNLPYRITMRNSSGTTRVRSLTSTMQLALSWKSGWTNTTLPVRTL